MAMDCEFVRAQNGRDMLARVSLVNFKGEVVYDTVVNPEEPIADYVTHITGLTAESLVGAPMYSEVNKYVVSLIKGTVVVGHTLLCDLEKFVSKDEVVCYIDVSEFKDYTKDGYNKSKLKDLSSIHLNAKI